MSSHCPPDLARIADAIALRGWCIAEQFLPRKLISTLSADAMDLWREGAYCAAGTGPGRQPVVRPQVRGDQIRWLEPPLATPAQQTCFERFEALRCSLNRELQLGLFDFECHFAVYPMGARYGRHLDRFKAQPGRALSCVLYLNERWQAEDAGQLRLYLDEADYVDVLPRGGTLVAFLSERFEHEVLPAHRERVSLTGWFRNRH